MGEVVFYVSGPDSSSGWQCSQKLGCGGSAITCAAWMTNSRCVPLIAARTVDTLEHGLTTHAYGQKMNERLAE